MESRVWRPFLMISWGSILGILSGAYFANTWLVMGLLGLIWLILFISYMTWGKGIPLLFILTGCMLFLGRFEWVDQQNQSQLDFLINEEQSYTVQGKIVSLPMVDGDRMTFDLSLLKVQNPKGIHPIRDENIRVSVRLEKPEAKQKATLLKRGSVIQTSIMFQKPLPRRNPGAFDYQKYLYQQKIHWLGSVEGLQQIQLLRSPHFHILAWVDELRMILANQIKQLYPNDHEGLIRALLLGERQEIDPEIEETYTALGMVHVLSVSGLHVSIVVTLLFFLLKKFQLTREQAAWMTLLFLPIYVLLTGAAAPILRAGLMMGFLLISMIFNQRKDVLSFLAIAFLIQLWWNPYWLFTASFQFTFLITFVLIVFVSPLVKQIPGKWRFGKQAFVVAWVAQMASFPIVIYFFHEFSFWSWFANLLFVPFLSGWVLPGAMFALAISFFSISFARFFAFLTSITIDGLHQAIDWLRPLFFPLHTFQPPSFFWFIGYGLASLYLWFSFVGDIRRQIIHRWMAASLLITMILFSYFPINAWGTKTRITFLDVGQGDCILIETDQGKNILIDGGGQPQGLKERWQIPRNPFDVGKRIVVPFLKYRGVNQLDTIIITHGDADHIGGLQAVVDRFPVQQVIRNSSPPQSNLEKSLMEKFISLDIPVYTAEAGMNVSLEPGISLGFLHPQETDYPNYPIQSSNNNSVVVFLSIYDHVVLMTGDIETQVETTLLREWNLPKVDVLKIAHHGSETSTSEAWLQAITPKEAVISVGKNNRYGHPSSTVIQRLRKYQVNIWRTDQHGAITMTFSPKRYSVNPMFSLN